MKKTNYKILQTKKEITDLIALLYRVGKFVIDLETTSLETHSESIKIVGAGFCIKPGQAFYIPFNSELSLDDIIEEIRIPLEDPNLPKIGQNIKYDARVLNRFGVQLRNIEMDTMVAHYCLFSDKYSHALDEMCMNHLGHIKIRTKSVMPKGMTMWDFDITKVGTYCMEDTDYTFRLYDYYSYLFTLPEHEYAKNVFLTLENKITPILLKMECNGVTIDRKIISDLKEEVISSITRLRREIDSVAGYEIVTTNPRQIGRLIHDDLKLFEKRGIKVKKTASGLLSTSAKTLELIKDEPIVGNILACKKLNKLLSTYIEPIPEAISSFTGRLHCSFNQHITNTGRLSSSSPNLQNIPQREELGRRIRKAFISRFPGGKILSADYSQQELRLLAHFSGEPSLLESFRDGKEDIHINTASFIYNIDKSAVDKAKRDQIKTVTYGLLYGMEAQKLSQTLNIQVEEAQVLLDKYMSKMTYVSKWISESRKFLQKYGYLESISGRRRYLPKIFSPVRFIRAAALREGPNMAIQGSAGDQVKEAMIQIDRYLEDKKSLLIMQVHDELVFDVHPDEVGIIDKDITNIMINAIPLTVPMEVSAHYAQCWGEAH